MVKKKDRFSQWLKAIVAIAVICGGALLVKSAAPSAEAVGTEKPELLVIERPYCEYVPIPEPVRVVIPVQVEKAIYIEVPGIASECAERWKGITITPQEKWLMACLAWREARGEGILGMRLVLEVVLNRVLSPHFPNTVMEVLYQPGHFTPSGEALELEDITPTDAQFEALDLVLSETPITEEDVVFFAQSPIYGEIFLHVGGHYFTRYPEE